MKVLLVDDDQQSLDSTGRILKLLKYEVVLAADGRMALEKAQLDSSINIVLTDLRMPGMDGIEFFKALKVCRPEIPVVMMTAYGRIEDAVWAMKTGAVDFLTKPFKKSDLDSALKVAIRRTKKMQVNQKEEPASSGLASILGESPEIQILRNQIKQMVAVDSPVLIQGESGTGKELVAKALHQLSDRREGPFVALNCAAIPENLMESELFGHEKGAFSGAIHTKKGLFEVANDGVLFLDEIGDMPFALQAKLLRVLQEGEVRRVGATHPIRVNVRIVSATLHDLQSQVKTRRFREDLLFRLDVLTLKVPPLRERKEDIPLLVQHFLEDSQKRFDQSVESISSDALMRLHQYSWPGNVRELGNVVERAVAHSLIQNPNLKAHQIEVRHLPDHLRDDAVLGIDGDSLGFTGGQPISIKLGTPLRKVEDLLIRKTLEATHGDKALAAKLLGVNSRTIYRRLERDKDQS